MKLRNAIFHLACLSLVTWAVASSNPQSPQPEPAEKRFKNIKVFKGVPADEIDPAMEMISASLGVRCDFCHVRTDKGGWQMDKDDKEEKGTAREMVLMTRKINEENFNGRMEITCATCHQGHAHPVSTPPLGAMRMAAPTAESASLPSADSLVDKYMQTVGGSSIDRLTSLHMKGTQESQGRSLTVESWAKAPNKSLSIVATPGGTFSEGFNGVTGWRSGPDGKAVALTGSDLEDAQRSAAFYATFKLKDQYKGFRRVREDTLDGQKVYVVDAQPAVGDGRERLYFDASTGMLVRTWVGKQTILGTLASTTDYLDYRDVAGVKIPFKVVDTTYRGPATTTYSVIEGNVEIPDSKFEKP